MVGMALLAATGLVGAGWVLRMAGGRGQVVIRDVQRNRPPAEAHVSSAPLAGGLALPDHATTPEAVRAVVRACRDATLADVAVLRNAAILSPDPIVAGNAVAALGRLGAFGLDDELRALLADPRQRVRQEAVRALGRSGGTGAVEWLIERLRSCEPEFAPLVLASLGELGDRRARDAVACAAIDPDRPAAERIFARAALRRIDPVRSR